MRELVMRFLASITLMMSACDGDGKDDTDVAPPEPPGTLIGEYEVSTLDLSGCGPDERPGGRRDHHLSWFHVQTPVLVTDIHEEQVEQPIQRGLLLYGGRTGPDDDPMVLNDLWMLDLGNVDVRACPWIHMSDAAAPGGMFGGSMLFDFHSAQVTPSFYLFGGYEHDVTADEVKASSAAWRTTLAGLADGWELVPQASLGLADATFQETSAQECRGGVLWTCGDPVIEEVNGVVCEGEVQGFENPACDQYNGLEWFAGCQEDPYCDCLDTPSCSNGDDTFAVDAPFDGLGFSSGIYDATTNLLQIHGGSYGCTGDCSDLDFMAGLSCGIPPIENTEELYAVNSGQLTYVDFEAMDVSTSQPSGAFFRPSDWPENASSGVQRAGGVMTGLDWRYLLERWIVGDAGIHHPLLIGGSTWQGLPPDKHWIVEEIFRQEGDISGFDYINGEWDPQFDLLPLSLEEGVVPTDVALFSDAAVAYEAFHDDLGVSNVHSAAVVAVEPDAVLIIGGANVENPEGLARILLLDVGSSPPRILIVPRGELENPLRGSAAQYDPVTKTAFFFSGNDSDNAVYVVESPNTIRPGATSAFQMGGIETQIGSFLGGLDQGDNAPTWVAVQAFSLEHSCEPHESEAGSVVPGEVGDDDTDTPPGNLDGTLDPMEPSECFANAIQLHFSTQLEADLLNSASVYYESDTWQGSLTLVDGSSILQADSKVQQTWHVPEAILNGQTVELRVAFEPSPTNSDNLDAATDVRDPGLNVFQYGEDEVDAAVFNHLPVYAAEKPGEDLAAAQPEVLLDVAATHVVAPSGAVAFGQGDRAACDPGEFDKLDIDELAPAGPEACFYPMTPIRLTRFGVGAFDGLMAPILVPVSATDFFLYIDSGLAPSVRNDISNHINSGAFSDNILWLEERLGPMPPYGGYHLVIAPPAPGDDPATTGFGRVKI